jgi:hypothetical protein
MADTVTPTIAASSKDVFNASGTATNTTTLQSIYQVPVYVNVPMLNAMGVEINGGDYAPIWDMLSIGGRITQDPNADQKVGPGVLAEMTISAIDTTIDTSGETAAVKAIYANQKIIADNLTAIVQAINAHRDNYSILLQYMINYKLLNPASS